jgi:hypothetical protein
MSANFGQTLPSSFHHGFRTNHSTTTAALTIQNSIAKAIDNTKKVVVVSNDSIGVSKLRYRLQLYSEVRTTNEQPTSQIMK